jgi:single-stranded DNA-binding protein
MGDPVAHHPPRHPRYLAPAQGRDRPHARSGSRTAWRSVAENASCSLKKGMRIFVAGKLVQRTWQDDGGNKCQTVEI